jgi:hypothetical protein
VPAPRRYGRQVPLPSAPTAGLARIRLSNRHPRLRVHARPPVHRCLSTSTSRPASRHHRRPPGAPPRDSPIELGFGESGAGAAAQRVSDSLCRMSAGLEAGIRTGLGLGVWWAVTGLVGWLLYSACELLGVHSNNRFLGSSVWLQLETEPKAEHRSSQIRKPNRTTEKPTFRFGFCSVRFVVRFSV